MLVFEERGKPEHPEKKPLGAQERTNNKLNPHVALTPGFEPEPHWWEATALTTAPSLAPFGVAYHYHFPQLNGYSSFIAANAANKHHPPLFTLPSTDQSPQHLSHKRSHLLLFSIYEVRSVLQRGRLFTIYCKSNRLLVQTNYFLRETNR